MRIKLLVLLAVIAINTSAQTKESTKTLFGSGKPVIGYFVSPSCQIRDIAGSTAVIPGISGGILLNESIYLGLNYKFSVTENTPAGQTDTRLYLDQKWGGLKFEYSLSPAKIVHLTFPVEAGISHIEYDVKDSYGDVGGFNVPNSDATFAYVEPGVALEVNLMKYAKLNLSVGYQLTNGVSFGQLTGKDLRGFVCGISLKIGLF
jgi:hypothetical protein